MVCKQAWRSRGRLARKAKGMKPHVVSCAERLDAIRDRAELYGISVDHRVIESGTQGRQTLHIMFFDADERRLVDYWPGTGTVLYGGARGDKTTAADLDEALELARRELRRRVQHCR